MINSEKIKARAKELGIRQSDIAKALGIKQATASQKINNVRPMSVDESEIMAKILRISNKDFASYFFSTNTEPSREEVRGVNPYYLKVEIQDDELKQVMDELEKAQKMIEACSTKLRFLGIKIVQKEETAL